MEATEDKDLGVEIVKIDYHVNFPAGPADPFNELNPTDPGARALYYNISTLPHTRMDGFADNTQLFSQWGENVFSRKVLALANADISAEAVLDEDSLKVTGSFSAITELEGTTLLYVAVIEEAIPVGENEGLSGRIGNNEDEFKYVLRKLLPNAAGKAYEDLGPTTPAIQTTFKFAYASPVFFKPVDDIGIVVFLQNEDTKEVYQAHLIRNIQEPGVPTGIDPERIVGIYPNPADRELRVELAIPVKKQTSILLYDQMGKLVKESGMEIGETSDIIVTENLAAGVYLIQVETPIGLVRKKIVVMHKN